MNFERGIEPRRAMGVGIITWENLSPGCSLRIKFGVPIRPRAEGKTDVYVIDCDSNLKKKNWSVIWTSGKIIPTGTVKVDKIEREIKHGTVMITLTFGENVVRGPIERFRKYFELCQNS